ncbi:hypothetical protein BDZ90DRAFT_228998 [Jaminaea rosea]|uniref:Methyltransferase domain-containing protein n=1 Tax=Jaminaea rosea TaxID=1569628 RepID=A0A316UXK7_9BASI|nr:hypothetical protein BDZ90DRAFT_228998 [Jaminaea rosea]PWN29952.1 hypothetical protein BDZ90DRAFT_228998 [Jaminaea rosea]
MSSLADKLSSWTQASPAEASTSTALALAWLNSPYVYSPLIAVLALLCVLRFSKAARTPLVFAWNCFVQPIGKVANQGERLDKFYQHQATIYDVTRNHLLRGRKTMLKLCAAQLHEMRRTQPSKPLIWVDVGGGTGWNIEQMAEYFPLEQLSHIYLIDLCEPLLDVARKRFAARGLKNVTVLCQDASEFTLPDLKEGKMIDLFTCSYSISMMPPFYAVLDRIYSYLDPETGVFGVVDFYVSGKTPPGKQSAMIGGDVRRECGPISRWFWRQWFSLDHVELHPARRDYLEYKFGTIKCFNGRNNFVIPFIVRIPFYVWIGCSRDRDTTKAVQAFEIEAGNRVICPPSFPELSFSHILAQKQEEDATARSSALRRLSLAQSTSTSSSSLVRRRGSDDGESDESLGDEGSGSWRLDLGPQLPLSSFHYQRRQWRLPFVDSKFSEMFRTWIYGFTWEDPYVDIEHMAIKPTDSVLCITSAGDNALHYAIAAKPERIHCVDMNPCQGHLLELKLACIAALSYEEFWKLFGDGKTDDFAELLDRKISPYLSSHAYQFWRLNTHCWDRNFYFRGYSGHALRLAKVAFSLFGCNRSAEAMCNAGTLEEQASIWKRSLRKTLINPTLINVFLSNPAFLWNALGVPINQFNCFRNEGVSAGQYAVDTLDPVVNHSLLKSDNYHYHLCLTGRYSHDSCPLYLKKEGFEALKRNAAKPLDAFRLHTDSIVNVLRGLGDDSLTHAVVMDHMDWFDPIPPQMPAPTLKQAREDPAVNSARATISDLDREIRELSRVVRPGGAVYWRSAAKEPWYRQRFEKMGFKTERLQVRESGKSIDRVNMYASHWKATRMS